MTSAFLHCSLFTIRFGSPFPIRFSVSDPIRLTVPNSTQIFRFNSAQFPDSIWIPFHVFYSWFYSQHTSTVRVTPQEVPHWLECPDKKWKSGIMEYFENLKTQIYFGRDTLVLGEKRDPTFSPRSKPIESMENL